MYGEATTEQHRPSLQPSSRKKKTLPFIASIQHVRNVNVMVQCELCGMWRLLYSKHKLNSQATKTLECELENISFSCGADLSTFELPITLKEVCARQLNCNDPVEKLY